MWLLFVLICLLGRPSNAYEFALIVWTLISIEAIVGVMYLFVMNFFSECITLLKTFK